MLNQELGIENKNQSSRLTFLRNYKDRIDSFRDKELSEFAINLNELILNYDKDFIHTVRSKVIELQTSIYKVKKQDENKKIVAESNEIIVRIDNFCREVLNDYIQTSGKSN